MRHRLAALIMLFLMVSFLDNGCSRKTRIGFLMDESATGRWVKDKALFIKNVEDMGGKVIFRSSEQDADKQVDLAREILKRKVDALVVVPTDLNVAANIVRLAHSEHVPVISYDRLIKNCNLDFYISFDNVLVGEMQANYITTLCPKGNYAILGGAVTDNNSFLLRLGQLSVLEPLIQRGDIHLVYDRYVDAWLPSEGYRLMKDCLKKNHRIDAVLASNDQLAEGAIKALTEAGVDPLPYISGQDADPEACRRILGGEQSMTVYKPIEAIAKEAAEVTMQIARDGTIPKTYLSVNNGKIQVPSLLLKPMLVNKETIDLTVNADQYMKDLEKTESGKGKPGKGNGNKETRTWERDTGK